MKVVKEVNREYYKYEWSELNTFTPTGRVSATNGWTNVQNAFDNNLDTYASCGTATDYIDILFESPIKITGVETYDGAQDNVSRKMGIRLYNIVNGIEMLIVDMKTSTTGSGGTYSNYYSTTFSEIQTSHVRIKLNEVNDQGKPPSTTVPSKIRTIKFTGKTSTITQGTSSNYDYYIDILTCKLPKSIERKYYKYIFEDWTQPVLTQYVMSGSSDFAVIGGGYKDNPAWRAFDNNDTTLAACHSSNYPDFIIYNPNPINITTLDFIQSSWSTEYYYLKTGTWQGSNDGVLWEDIQSVSASKTKNINLSISTDKFYKYHRMKIDSTYHSGYWMVLTCNITAVEKIKTAGTPDDYDYYIDVPTYYGINQ